MLPTTTTYLGGPLDGRVAPGCSTYSQDATEQRDAEGRRLFRTYSALQPGKMHYLGLKPFGAGRPIDEKRCYTADDSPALRSRSEHYPAEFGGRVPLSIRIKRHVYPDPIANALVDPLTFRNIRMTPGTIVQCWVNSHGAVAALLPFGGMYGLTPDQFDVVGWHAIRQEPAPP